MIRSSSIRGWLLAGALAGLCGGLVFGAAMAMLGSLPTIASIVHTDSAVVGFALHMMIAAVVGAGLGVLTRRQRTGAGEMLFWGLAYGALWWYIGPLTLLPLLRGQGLAWDVPFAQGAFPSLLGHLLYGATTSLALIALRGERPPRPSAGALLRGAIAGVLAAYVAGSLLRSQGRLPWFSALPGGERLAVAWLAALLIGVLSGAGLALLYPRSFESAGAGLVRGTLYGFFVWIVIPRTLLPVLGGDGLPWGVDDTRRQFAPLIGYMLFGAALAVLYQWLSGAWRLLFEDDLGEWDEEGAGTQGLRAVGRGTLAGVIGGLLFTLVMVQIGFLPTVAKLIHAGSATTGFFVHLVISILIGSAYGLLFRRQSYDLGSAVGWGVSYGFFWWLLGPLTLLPLLLGTAPNWTAEVAGGLTASLVGHLAYGAGLGITFHHLEARFSPWWIPHEVAGVERAAMRRTQVLTSAPALWTLTVAIALTLPIVLAPTNGVCVYGSRCSRGGTYPATGNLTAQQIRSRAAVIHPRASEPPR